MYFTKKLVFASFCQTRQFIPSKALTSEQRPYQAAHTLKTYMFVGSKLRCCHTTVDSNGVRHMDRNTATKSYPVAKVVDASRGTRVWCTKRINALLPQNYQTCTSINRHNCTGNRQVPGQTEVKRTMKRGEKTSFACLKNICVR